MDALNRSSELPPLPEYTLTPVPPLAFGIPDKYLELFFPIVAYWVFSLLFHWIDVNDYFSRYRLHTPAEVLKRNHVSRYEVIRDVMIQQIVQTAVGGSINYFEPEDFLGKDNYNIAVWATRIRLAERVIPGLLSLFGVNAFGFANKISDSHPMLSGMLAGGSYSGLTQLVTTKGSQHTAPAFAPWEVTLAKAIYHVLIPAVQFLAGVFILDTWQYFLHRAMHMNKWLYTTFHSRHHRLYVPYAFGALYNHPFEGFLLDTIGAGLAWKVTGMTLRQGMWFYTGCTIKTVDDHCGYSLPWDPLQYIFPNNAGYHDIHHQSWGIKTNFSQPFFTFWDHLLGTIWTGGDVSARYERAATLAQKKLDSPVTGTSQDANQPLEPYQNEIRDAKLLSQVPDSMLVPEIPEGKAAYQAAGSREQVLEDTRDGGMSILAEEAAEERTAEQNVRTTNHRRTASNSLKGLRQRVSSFGRKGGIIGVEKR